MLAPLSFLEDVVLKEGATQPDGRLRGEKSRLAEREAAYKQLTLLANNLKSPRAILGFHHTEQLLQRQAAGSTGNGYSVGFSGAKPGRMLSARAIEAPGLSRSGAIVREIPGSKGIAEKSLIEKPQVANKGHIKVTTSL